MVMRPTTRRPRRWIWFVVAVVLAALGSYVVWARTPPTPMTEAYLAMESDHVMVIDGPWLTMLPLVEIPTSGLIFYPGARIDPRAYAPFAEELAEQGYLVVIVPMPLNLAILGTDKASDVMAMHAIVETWVVGGHSLGGAMAARYAANNPQEVDGLLLWAAYPPDSEDLSSSDIKVMSIYATLDGLTTLDDIQASRSLLPPSTTYVEIKGGNHAGFGWYGDQRGDLEPTIGRPLQARQVTQVTIEFLAAVSAGD